MLAQRRPAHRGSRPRPTRQCGVLPVSRAMAYVYRYAYYTRIKRMVYHTEQKTLEVAHSFTDSSRRKYAIMFYFSWQRGEWSVRANGERHVYGYQLMDKPRRDFPVAAMFVVCAPLLLETAGNLLWTMYISQGASPLACYAYIIS